jgi:hypothetical protein
MFGLKKIVTCATCAKIVCIFYDVADRQISSACILASSNLKGSKDIVTSTCESPQHQSVAKAKACNGVHLQHLLQYVCVSGWSRELMNEDEDTPLCYGISV